MGQVRLIYDNDDSEFRGQYRLPLILSPPIGDPEGSPRPGGRYEQYVIGPHSVPTRHLRGAFLTARTGCNLSLGNLFEELGRAWMQKKPYSLVCRE